MYAGPGIYQKEIAMQIIIFTHEYTVQDSENPASFNPGDKLECEEPSARHFIKRGVALLEADYKAMKAAEAEAKKAEAAAKKAAKKK